MLRLLKIIIFWVLLAEKAIILSYSLKRTQKVILFNRRNTHEPYTSIIIKPVVLQGVQCYALCHAALHTVITHSSIRKTLH